MLKRLAVLAAALAVSSAAVAHADSISGFFSATGTNSFTSSTLTFAPPQNSVIAGAIGGTFAGFLTDNNPITFAAGPIPYVQGNNVPPAIQLFSTTEAGETFGFTVSNFNANFVNNGTQGCLTGNTCLTITGIGTFTGTGAVSYTPTPAEFQYSSQYVIGQPVGGLTTFSASTSATPPPIPEPASLALFGTGLVGLVGIARRKLSA